MIANDGLAPGEASEFRRAKLAVEFSVTLTPARFAQVWLGASSSCAPTSPALPSRSPSNPARPRPSACSR